LKVIGYTGTLEYPNKIKIDDTNMILYKNIKVPQYSRVPLNIQENTKKSTTLSYWNS